MQVNQVFRFENRVAFQLGAPMPVLGLAFQQPVLRRCHGLRQLRFHVGIMVEFRLNHDP
jgi:hypothetical protein